MRIALINIGDELLAGKILNTNARDLALWLTSLGHEQMFALTIPDDIGVLVDILKRETSRSDGPEIIILSGGLGPTRDDLTREALARFLGTSVESSEEARMWLAEYLKRPVEASDPQVQVPRGAQALRNPAGTACGLRIDVKTADGGSGKPGCVLFAFPGVPREYKALFDLYTRPLLEQRDAHLIRRRLITFGLGESRQRDLLKGLVIPPPFRFSSLPSDSEVTISIEGFAENARLQEQEAILDKTWQSLIALLPPETIVDVGGASLTETVYQSLLARGATVTVAESCTGGAVGHLLTEVPGSSAVFREGYLTYSNEAKTKLLGVPEALLKAHGAVSEPVALAMARGARAAAGSDYAVSVTGIAGPDGGSPEKPVGLVYIAVAGPTGAESARFEFKGTREMVRRRASRSALNQLRLLILKDLQQQK